MMREVQELRRERDLEQFELRELRRKDAERRIQFRGLGEGEQGQCPSLIKQLKPDVFDASESLPEYLAQFELISHANDWSEREKAVVLASCLRGRARTILDSVDPESLNFAELKSKLELCFGEGSSQNYYVLFTSRKQKFGENYASLGLELERLSRLAYPECPFPVRDRIACAQFIAAIFDDFVRRTLQLEGVSSLVTAIERAKVIKAIQDENFRRKKSENFRRSDRSRNFVNNINNDNRNNFGEYKREGRRFEKEGRKVRMEKKGNDTECWQCGSSGHFRAECPTLNNPTK